MRLLGVNYVEMTKWFRAADKKKTTKIKFNCSLDILQYVLWRPVTYKDKDFGIYYRFLNKTLKRAETKISQWRFP